jgi:hypothetical protein
MKPVDRVRQTLRTAAARRNIGTAGSRIFLVHGRDLEAASWMRECLSQLGMRTIEWNEAISLTGSASPYILDVVRAGMNAADATVVLFTGDEEVELRPNLQKANEAHTTGYQSRPNVWLEAGISLAIDRSKTIFIEYGDCRTASDLNGIHFLHCSEDTPINEFMRTLATRLITAGCKANLANMVSGT